MSCSCFYVTKLIREASGSDALWMYDPGPGTSFSSRQARHGQGPAPSMNSFITLTETADTLGAILDINGYITTLFTVSGVTLSRPVAAWNGSSVAWIGERPTTGGNVIWRSFDLSGTQLGTFSGGFSGWVNPNSVACDSSGNLIFGDYFQTQRRNSSGTLLNSLSSGGTILAVDSSGNITIGDGGTGLSSYSSSFSSRWSTTISGGYTQFGCVCDSSGNVLVGYGDSSGNLLLRKYTSTGGTSWTSTLPFSGGSSTISHLWSDGANTYLTARDAATQPRRLKYDASGTLQWNEAIWWRDGYNSIETIRADGNHLVLAGSRG